MTTTESAIIGGAVFAVDVETRVIRGLAVPFGKIGVKNGQRFMFSKGTVTWDNPKHVKLYVHHDPHNAVGVAFELTETDEGIVGAFKIARGSEGDKALTMADDEVWDGLSIGPHEGVRFELRDGIQHAVNYPLQHVALTPQPVFGNARLSSVSMSNTTTPKEGTTVTTTETTAPEQVTAPGPDFAALTTGLTEAIKAGFGDLTFPQRELVDPSGSATFEVNEPSPYRFDGIAGAQSFSEDLRSYPSDPEARGRLDKFMQEAWDHQFAVTGANTASLNPTQNRPDLYVPNLTFTRPLWDLVTTGTVDDKTPFTIPKFSSASGMVATHTEGVEPTPGAFAATSQTVTPTPLSGKVEIVREVWDQGGSPQADQIIWGEMMNGYFEAIEARINTVLAAVPTAEINFASAVDEALVDALQNVLVDLQYVRGGNRFTGLALDGMLFKALIGASDTAGRKLLPVLAAQNAQGTTDGGFSEVVVGNLRGRAAWALGATNASKSYLLVPSSVYAWASAPKKFTFEYRVSAIDMAIWGYSAAAVTRDSDVKPLDYTTADA